MEEKKSKLEEAAEQKKSSQKCVHVLLSQVC